MFLINNLYVSFLMIQPKIKYMMNIINTLMKIFNPLSLDFIMPFMQKYETTPSMERLNRIQNIANTIYGFFMSLQLTHDLRSCIDIFIFALQISQEIQYKSDDDDQLVVLRILLFNWYGSFRRVCTHLVKHFSCTKPIQPMHAQGSWISWPVSSRHILQCGRQKFGRHYWLSNVYFLFMFSAEAIWLKQCDMFFFFIILVQRVRQYQHTNARMLCGSFAKFAEIRSHMRHNSKKQFILLRFYVYLSLQLYQDQFFDNLISFRSTNSRSDKSTSSKIKQIYNYRLQFNSQKHPFFTKPLQKYNHTFAQFLKKE